MRRKIIYTDLRWICIMAMRSTMQVHAGETQYIDGVSVEVGGL